MWVDPLKDVQAGILGIGAGLTNRAKLIVSEQGGDYEEVFEQLAEENKELAEEAGPRSANSGGEGSGRGQRVRRIRSTKRTTVRTGTTRSVEDETSKKSAAGGSGRITSISSEVPNEPAGSEKRKARRVAPHVDARVRSSRRDDSRRQA